LDNYKNEQFLEILEDFNLIPIEKFIGLLQEESKRNHKFMKSVNLLDFINEFRRSVSNNVSFSSQYEGFVQNLISILKYNVLLREKEFLLKELEVTERYKKSSDIKAISDLLKKLRESLATNKNKLKFLEEDYFQWKNQIDQINQILNEYNSKIQELTKQKKQCFSQINRITRLMSGDPQISKADANYKISETNGDLTNAEKIKNLQLKAKNIQSEINDIKSKKSQTQLKLEEVTPIFETYRNDYQLVLQLINTEEEKIIDMQSEIKNKITHEETISTQELDLIDLKSLKSLREIEDEIKNTDSELNKIVIPENLYDPQNPGDLSPLMKKLSEFNEDLIKHESEIIININEQEISECFEQFRELEQSLTEIESFTDRFLSEISLKSQFRIIISSDNKNFFIDLKFIRNDKEQVNFNELTTPEKIFFIIVFYISVKLHIKNKNIIFSNASILSKYNKAGSIYRTIRKVLPIFEIEDALSKINLIFIISNLELKQEIKNLKIKTLQGN